MKKFALFVFNGDAMCFLNDMNGHPGMAEYRNDGYEIITF
jgi:hypothetical protein